MRGKGQLKKVGVEDGWEGGFTKLALLHAASLSVMTLMQI